MAKNYNKYKLEDFLADTDFVLWCLNPDKDADGNWNDFAKKYPVSAAEFYRAVAVIKSVRFNYFTLPSEEKLSLFNGIMDEYDTLCRLRTRRLLTRWITASAVAAAVLLVPILMFTTRNKEQVNTVLSGNEIQLVTENDTTVIPSESAYLEYTPEGNLNVNGKARQLAETNPQKQTYSPAMNELIVPAGRRAFVILADGTKVWVNSGSKLKYPSTFTESERNIYVDGEIYVDVRTDSLRHFIVHTRGFSARVLGTSFNVRSNSDATRPNYVVLVEGSVEVTVESGEKVMLEPSQMMNIKSGGWSVREVDVFQYISWKDGLLMFSGDTLDHIFSQISRFYNVSIDYSPAVGRMTCSGKLVLFEELQVTLDVITRILPLRYTIIDDRVSIYMN